MWRAQPHPRSQSHSSSTHRLVATRQPGLEMLLSESQAQGCAGECLTASSPKRGEAWQHFPILWCKCSHHAWLCPGTAEHSYPTRTPRLCFGTQARAWQTVGTWEMYEEERKGEREEGRKKRRKGENRHTYSITENHTAQQSHSHNYRLKHTEHQILIQPHINHKQHHKDSATA